MAAPEQRTTPRVLVADRISPVGIDRLREGAAVDVATGLTEAELCQRMGDYDALVVRSETQVTAAVLKAGKRLRIVARAGVGVDNIDVPAATEQGILVVNSPEGNTIAAAEHTVAMLLALSRKIPAAAQSLREGEWARGRFVGTEVYQKTLGVIGFGKIGREVARRARGLGMQVLASDVFVSPEQASREGVELVDLPALLARADYVTVHVPLTRDTRGLLGEEEFRMMKRGARLLNCARGGIVDEKALLAALEAGQLAGAALDVFSKEPPPPDEPLLRHPKVVATPHLGASTEEAQTNVALDVAEQILAVLAGRPATTAVNVPAISPEVYARLEPYLRLGTRLGRLQAQLAEGPIGSVSVTYGGELVNQDLQPVTRAILVGLLQPVLAQPVNEVNAPTIAEQRGIRVTESKTAGDADLPNSLRIEVEDSARRRSVTGTALNRRDLRIRAIDDFPIDLVPEGYLLFTIHEDRPGIIGAVGTLLGARGINIAGMHVGRDRVGGRAVMVLTVDDPVPETLLEEIQREIAAQFVRFVEL
jgi:D-3-phosphoglycerate dehydrogenase